MAQDQPGLPTSRTGESGQSIYTWPTYWCLRGNLGEWSMWKVYLVGGLVAINFIFPLILGFCPHPNWRSLIFFRGVAFPNHQANSHDGFPCPPVPTFYQWVGEGSLVGNVWCPQHVPGIHDGNVMAEACFTTRWFLGAATAWRPLRTWSTFKGTVLCCSLQIVSNSNIEKGVSFPRNRRLSMTKMTCGYRPTKNWEICRNMMTHDAGKQKSATELLAGQIK